MADGALNTWLEEIDFDPSSPWLAMGTRALGDQPWLIVDARHHHELELRAQLIAERPEDVIVAPASAAPAVAEIIDLVSEDGRSVEPSTGAAGASAHNGLARLGRSVTEDLCVLRRGRVEWEFEAAVLCFPSRWRLVDRVGRPLREVHGPTPGFDPVLADRITSLLDRLDARIVRRRNWFVHPNPALFQPDRPSSEPVVSGDRVLDELFVRSERQTLRALPLSERVLFTVKTQQCSLGEGLADAGRREAFVNYLREAPADQSEHRGISPDQRRALLASLG